MSCEITICLSRSNSLLCCAGVGAASPACNFSVLQLVVELEVVVVVAVMLVDD